MDFITLQTHTMRKLRIHSLFIMLCVVFYVPNTFSQTKISLFNIDTTAFPRISASIQVKDTSGRILGPIALNDIRLLENAVDVRPSPLTISCDTLLTPLAVCMVLDQSQSMKEISNNGESYWKWVRDGAVNFINSINFTPPTVVAVTSFGGTSTIRSPFRSSPPPLITAIDAINPGGATDYNEAFLDVNGGGSQGALGVMRTAPPLLKKVIVFLTDGLPDKTVQTQRILDSCFNNDITVFSIILRSPSNPTVNPDIQSISNKTGGQSFVIDNKADLLRVYEQIAKTIQRSYQCRISWLSTFGCTQAGRTRALDLTYSKSPRNAVWRGSYLAPVSSLTVPTLSTNAIVFADPGVGLSDEQEFTVRNNSKGTFILSRMTFANTNFSFVSSTIPFGTPMRPGESTTIKVQFTQSAVANYPTSFATIEGTCPVRIDFSVTKQTLKLERPLGNEVYSFCDSIPIEWSGIPANEPIEISYSSDQGRSWLPITNVATGLKYMWHTSIEWMSQFKVRVSRRSCSRLIRIGGVGNDTVNVIKYLKNGDIALGGSFNTPFSVETNALQPLGGNDGLLAIFDSLFQSKYVIQVRGTNDERVQFFATDSARDFIIAGTTSSPIIEIANGSKLVSTTIPNSGKEVVFVAKINRLGIPLWVRTFSSPTPSQSGSLEIASLSIIRDSTILLQGYQRGDMQYINQGASTDTLILKTPIITTRVAKFDVRAEIQADGIATWYSALHSIKDVIKPSHADSYGATTAIIKTFSGTLSCSPSSSINSTGGSDMGIILTRRLTGQSDQSPRNFSVQRTSLQFGRDVFTMFETAVGDSANYNQGVLISNSGLLTTNIDSMVFIGRDAVDFRLDSYPSSLAFGQSAPPNIWFKPRLTSYNLRGTYLVAFPSNCANPVFTTFQSLAKFDLPPTIDSVDFLAHRIGTSTIDTITIKSAIAITYKVKDITPVNGNPTSFTYRVELPPNNDLIAGSAGRIIVTFKPDKEPLEKILFKITFTDSKVELFGQAQGSGFLPTISGSPYSFKSQIVNTLSDEIGTLRFTNTHQTRDVRIFSGSVTQSANGAFYLDSPVPDTVLKAGEQLLIPIRFLPKVTGIQRGTFRIISDAAPGPDTLPKTPLDVDLDGDGIDVITSDRTIVFNPILACSNDTRSFSVRNLSDRDTVRINEIRTSSGQSFQIVPRPVFPILITPKGQVGFTIQYTPSSVQTVTDRLIIIHTGGIADTLDLSASGITAELKLSSLSIPRIGTDSTDVIVSAKLTSTIPASLALDSLSLVLRFNESFISLDTNQLKQSFNGWNWKCLRQPPSWLLSGTKAGGVTMGNESVVLKLSFKTFLSQYPIDTIRLLARADNVARCLQIDSTSSLIKYETRCAYAIRGVQFGPEPTLQLAQSNDNITLTGTLPFSIPATMEFYSLLGNKVASDIINVNSDGHFTNVITVNDISNGMYFLRIRQADLEITKSVYLLR
jgi:hypothetical protein